MNPGLPEDCLTLRDDNCNGDDNEPDGLNCAYYCTATRTKTATACSPAVCLCYPDGLLTAAECTDCDDGRDGIHPGQPEDCETPYDDDCTGTANDENALGCTDWYWDADGDGYGTEESICTCSPVVDLWDGLFYRAERSGDCDDENRGVNPGAEEICGNDVDENCNGWGPWDECTGCIVYFLDADQDGWGVSADYQCLYEPLPPYTAVQSGDCRDDYPEINPAADEVCDGIDNNCNILVDDDEFGFPLPCGVCGLCIDAVCVEQCR